MSRNVFFFLKINDKFVRLADMDEVLCQSLGLTVSSNEYLIPEGNNESIRLLREWYKAMLVKKAK